MEAQERQRYSGFWSFAKERLAKYHGVASHLFWLYLKEQEFRVNYRKDDILKTLKKWLGPETDNHLVLLQVRYRRVLR